MNSGDRLLVDRDDCLSFQSARSIEAGRSRRPDGGRPKQIFIPGLRIFVDGCLALQYPKRSLHNVRHAVGSGKFYQINFSNFHLETRVLLEKTDENSVIGRGP